MPSESPPPTSLAIILAFLNFLSLYGRFFTITPTKIKSIYRFLNFTCHSFPQSHLGLTTFDMVFDSGEYHPWFAYYMWAVRCWMGCLVVMFGRMIVTMIWTIKYNVNSTFAVLDIMGKIEIPEDEEIERGRERKHRREFGMAALVEMGNV